tara:strand:+ start:4275 stop:4466 length:192 start_codon:yes stop_codon:yes gene_type:complete
MRKPAIPAVPRIADNRTRFDSSLKECIETITGRNGGSISLLNRDTATLDDCAAKINEIIELLQ